MHEGLTRENYREVLTKYLTAGSGQGFCVNLSVDTSSLDVMRHCRELGALYVDTVIEPWPGFYYDKSLGNDARTNYALRKAVLAERRKNPGGSTAVSCCGANPGMVSWFVKQALVNLARDLGDKAPSRRARTSGRVSRSASASRACISPSATRSAPRARSRATCSSTPGRSKASCRKGCSRPNSAGARHEKWAPANAGYHKAGCGAAIYHQPARRQYARALMDADRAAQFGFLVTHNEAISIADYYTVRDDKGEAVYRPTCHYAYHPCDDAVL